ncbi:unnamed protein product [Camellia sinensis]
MISRHFHAPLLQEPRSFPAMLGSIPAEPTFRLVVPVNQRAIQPGFWHKLLDRANGARHRPSNAGCAVITCADSSDSVHLRAAPTPANPKLSRPHAPLGLQFARIVPNFAISKILSRDNNKVRILQDATLIVVCVIFPKGCEGLLYVALHARVILDLCEHLEQEISFEQVEGDFNFFQGKWLLEQLGNHHTLLKYSVESKMHKNSFLSEAIMEEVIYEDLPSNLCAIRDYIEKREAQNTLETCDHAIFSEEQTASSSKDRYDDRMSVEKDFDFDSDSPHPSRQRPRVPGLRRDIEVLKAELITFISEYGQ